MEELFNTLRRNFGDFRKRFETGIKEDFERTKTEARALLDLGNRFAADAAKETARISEELVVEFKVESSLILRQLQKHLISEAFEGALDEVIEHSGKNEEFEAASTAAPEWFTKLHASLYKDPFEGPEGEAARARRDRIGRKIAFLFRFYRDGVFDAAKAGALIGGFFGPGSALRLAFVAGGLKLIFMLGGSTYSILIKDNGEWSFATA